MSSFCINKHIKFDLPEKRISLFGAIYSSPTVPQVGRIQQNHANFERYGMKTVKGTKIDTKSLYGHCSVFLGVDSLGEGEVL